MPLLKLEPETLLRFGLVFLLVVKCSDHLVLYSANFSAVVFFSLLILCPVVLFTRSSLAPILLAVLIFGMNMGWVNVSGYFLRSHHMLVMALAFWCLSLAKNRKLFYTSLSLLIFFVYVVAALRKLQPEYISGMRFEQILREYYLGSEMVLSAASVLALQILSILSVMLEFILGLFPWLRGSSQKVALISGAGLHIIIAVLMPVSVFSALMVLLLFVLWSFPFEDRQFVTLKRSC